MTRRSDRARNATFAAIVVGVLVLSACGETTAPTSTGATTDPDATTAPATDATPPGEGEVLRLGYWRDVSTMDPHFMTDSETQDMLSGFYENFTQLTPDGSIEPWLITEWEPDADNVVWTLTVREGVTCHDGEAFDADDVVYSLLRARDHPDSGRSSYALGWRSEGASVTAVDSHTVEIDSTVPYLHIPVDLAWINAMCKDYHESVGDEGLAAEPVGTGPYRFVEYLPGENLTGVRFEEYWGEAPDFDEFVIRIAPVGATRVASLLAGEVDFAGSLTAEEAFAAGDAEGFSYVSKDSTLVVNLRMDIYRPELPTGEPNPFVDVRVRQAVWHALDVDTIVEEVMQGEGRLAHQFWIPAVFGYDPDLQRLPYDPERARGLLSEAGWADGFDVTLHGGADVFPNDILVAQVVADQLADVGIRVTVDMMQPALLTELEGAGETAFTISRSGQGNLDLYNTYDAFFLCGGRANNIGGTGENCLPELDTIAQAANAETGDLAGREELLQELNRMVHLDHTLVVPMFELNRLGAISDRVEWEPGWLGRARVKDFHLSQ